MASHFDRIAGAYNRSLPSHVVAHYLDRRFDLLREVVPPPGPVLDVGCGTGLLAWKLNTAGYAVTGLDASRGMLSEGEALPGYPGGIVELFYRVQGDATHLPFRDCSFPAVVTIATLHHIVAPDLVRAAIHEMLRVTTPCGAAVIWDHNPLNPYWPFLMRRVPQDEGDTRLVPLSEILAALDGASVQAFRRGWVPDFVPAWGLPALAILERTLEAVPGIKAFAAHNVVIVRKRDPA